MVYRTSVVLPMPWRPLRPMKKGVLFAFLCSARRARMKEITMGDLSSLIEAISGPKIEAVVSGVKDVSILLRHIDVSGEDMLPSFFVCS